MLRLDVNTSGAWKTVVPEFEQDAIEGVREAALQLARVAKHRPVAWRIVDLDTDAHLHPQGQVLWVTADSGPTTEWRAWR